MLKQSQKSKLLDEKLLNVMGRYIYANENSFERVTQKTNFDQPLQKNQRMREDVDETNANVEMMRLFALQTCSKIDQSGVSANVNLSGAAKIALPLMVQTITGRCMQMHGGGLPQDYFIADACHYGSSSRLADGPDQVHKMVVGKKIIDKYTSI